ncbi:MAG: FAD-dependent oxidoreductase [Paracoccaceae bacterium]
MSGHRLRAGGVVARTRPLAFDWDGTRHFGLEGDTLASAMLANGLGTVARGFKYHRPRGVMTAGVEETGALVTLERGPRREPNAKAPAVELFEGLEASGQNAWPSVRFDLGRVNDLLGRFFAAGFYYKTFMGRPGSTRDWMRFETLIRRAAGMGRAADPAAMADDADAYDVVHDHCDVAVVGGGVAGLAAAEEAASAGLDVVLIEQDFRLGGRAIGADAAVAAVPAPQWIERMETRLSGLGVRVLTRAPAFGLYDANVLGIHERAAPEPDPDPLRPREALRILRPARVILATGAIERPMVFADNDRPGVMLAGAAERYVRRFAVAPGSRAVVATTGARGYETAVALAAAGVETTLLDASETARPGLRESMREHGVEVLAGYVPVRAIGRDAVHGVAIGRAGDIARGVGETTVERVIEADCLLTTAGWSPAIHLVAHRGVKPVWDDAQGAFLSGAPPEGVAIAGAANARGIAAIALLDGRHKAIEAVEALGGRPVRRERWAGKAVGTAAADPVLHEIRERGAKLKSFLDPQHDVTTEDVRLAAREGYASVEHMKRYTTLGMATDQGKTGGVAGLAVLAEALGQTIPETGITTFRPPYAPVPIAAMAGRARRAHWAPERLTPMHDAHVAAGAAFTDAGLWRRAWYYPRSGEGIEAAYLREARTVRAACGVVDVSTLGKIEVQGADAGAFLNRVYVNGFAKLAVGRCRYGVMLRDDGHVLDDGVVWRLAEDRYWLTCTTAEAAAVMHWLDTLLAWRWQDLDVRVCSTTDQWAGLAVAGPRSRAALERVLTDGDVSNEALPFMGIARTRVRAEGGTVPVMIGRVSFSGELAYELHTSAGWGEALWRSVLAAAEAEGGSAYGLEALGALRIEKGHVTAAELDGRTTLEDAGLGRMASTKKPYVGGALATRPGLARADRPRLVHVVPVEPGARFSGGAILRDPALPDGGGEGHGGGWITGVTESVVWGGWLGIGFVSGGAEAWAGREIEVAEPIHGRACRARIEPAHRLDPKGERMHA